MRALKLFFIHMLTPWTQRTRLNRIIGWINLAIIAGYAESMGIAWDHADALEWSRRRGQRSGRVAWQYVTELAGRAGQAI